MLTNFGPAETTNYLIFGFAVIFGTLILHIASIAIRARNLSADLLLIEDIQKKGKKKPAKRKKPK
jgi:hypothetical protein